MSDVLERYEDLAQDIALLKQRAAEAKGASVQLKKQLKEHGITTPKQAERRFKELKQELEKLERQFIKEMEDFEEQWGDLLDEVS